MHLRARQDAESRHRGGRVARGSARARVCACARALTRRADGTADPSPPREKRLDARPRKRDHPASRARPAAAAPRSVSSRSCVPSTVVNSRGRQSLERRANRRRAFEPSRPRADREGWLADCKGARCAPRGRACPPARARSRSRESLPARPLSTTNTTTLRLPLTRHAQGSKPRRGAREKAARGRRRGCALASERTAIDAAPRARADRVSRRPFWRDFSARGFPTGCERARWQGSFSIHPWKFSSSPLAPPLA